MRDDLVDLGLGDHQRGSEPDGVAVGVLGQHLLDHEPVADLLRRAEVGVHVDAQPQAGLADRGGPPGVQQRLQAGAEPLAEDARAFLHLAGGQQLDHGRADGAGQRVAAERRPVLAGLEQAEDLAVRDHGRQRHDAAAERLAEHVDVGLDALAVAGERRAGAAQARLDLVGDHQHAAARGDLTHLRQETLRRHDHAGLALDGLEQHGHGVVVDGGLDGVGVPERNVYEARGVGGERLAGVLVVAERDDRRGTAVEIALHHDDLGPALGDALGFVPPLAGGLDRGLDGLDAGVHGQDHVLAAHLGQRLHERAERLGVERARGQRDLAQLRLRGRHQRRVAVAEVDRRVGRQAVDVVVAVEVGDAGALGRGDDHRQRGVVVRPVRLDLVDRHPLSLGTWLECHGPPLP